MAFRASAARSAISCSARAAISSIVAGALSADTYQGLRRVQLRIMIAAVAR